VEGNERYVKKRNSGGHAGLCCLDDVAVGGAAGIVAESGMLDPFTDQCEQSTKYGPTAASGSETAGSDGAPSRPRIVGNASA